MPDRSPSLLRLWSGQVRYAFREFWRTPVAAFFTLGFPLMFLVLLCALYGNAVLDDRNGVRLAQFVTPAFAVFGVVMASFAMLAIGITEARERGVLKRLRGTPLPPVVHLAGRIGSAVLVSLLATSVLVGVGVAFYGVQIVGPKLLAAVVTLVVGIACFASLGVAVAGLAPTGGAATAITTGMVIPLAFVSDVFTFGDLPPALSRIGSLFPLRHFANALSGTFDPYAAGRGFAGWHLLVMIAWGAVGLAVAARTFAWEPRPSGSAQVTAPLPAAGRISPPDAVTSVAPNGCALLRDQVHYANRQLVLDRTSMFFGIAFPALLTVLFATLYGEATWHGMPLAQYVAPAMAVYGVATIAYVNLPQVVAEARERGVLKRLAGTPMPWWSYLTGRMVSALALSGVTVAVTLGVSVLALGVSVPAGSWPAVVLTYGLLALCFAAMGLALAAVLRGAQTVTVVALATLIPLSFISDIFLVVDDGMPRALDTLGWLFPLRHAVRAAVQAMAPGASGAASWGDLAVVLLWGLCSAGVAWSWMSVDPRTSSRHREAPTGAR